MQRKKNAPVDMPPAPKFSKEQFMKSGNRRYSKDAIVAVLEDGKSYTKEEAEGLISSYLERKV